jgi:hypothetical protein
MTGDASATRGPGWDAAAGGQGREGEEDRRRQGLSRSRWMTRWVETGRLSEDMNGPETELEKSGHEGYASKPSSTGCTKRAPVSCGRAVVRCGRGLPRAVAASLGHDLPRVVRPMGPCGPTWVGAEGERPAERERNRGRGHDHRPHRSPRCPGVPVSRILSIRALPLTWSAGHPMPGLCHDHAPSSSRRYRSASRSYHRLVRCMAFRMASRCLALRLTCGAEPPCVAQTSPPRIAQRRHRSPVRFAVALQRR